MPIPITWLLSNIIGSRREHQQSPISSLFQIARLVFFYNRGKQTTYIIKVDNLGRKQMIAYSPGLFGKGAFEMIDKAVHTDMVYHDLSLPKIRPKT